MSYEDTFLSNMDRNLSKKEKLLDKTELLDELLKKRETFLKENRPNEKDFADIYGEEEIEKDLKEIAFLKGEWAKEAESEEDFEKYLKKVSSLYEILLAEQIEKNDWLGENCDTFVASEYDDIKNGIDVGLVFKAENKEYLGFSADVTFASNEKVLNKKLDSIKECIRSGSLPHLKYFQDPETGKHKKIFLPKVVVGSQLASAEDLIELWGSHDPHKNKKLAEHPVQAKIIAESLYQLEYFYKYANELSDKYYEDDKEKSDQYWEIATSYGGMYNVFLKIYESKKELVDSKLKEIENDPVYKTICEYTEH